MSIALARARLTDGDIAGARAAFDQLRVTPQINRDLALLEAMLLDAEGRAEDALACILRVALSTAAATATVALAHAHSARLAVRLGREDVAEASGNALLALDPEDLDGLRAVAFAHRRQDDAELQLPMLRRLAAASGAAEADIWFAVEALADFGRWDEVLDLIERHELELDPWRMAPLRVRALVELGWRRRALEVLRKAHADEHIRAGEAVELLVRWRALALAATFIRECMSADPWRSEARASVMETATRTCTALSLEEAPIAYADAIQACDILTPKSERTEAAVANAVLALVKGSEELWARNDPAGATHMLVVAVRLAPGDRKLLESLADSAGRAHQAERRLDTLLRIWETHQDVSALLAAAHGVLEVTSWSMIMRVMTIVAKEAGLLGSEVDTLIERFHEQARRRVDDHLRAGDLVAGLELAIDLSRRWSLSEWPDDLLSRLLRATKRRLRSQRPGAEALIATVGELYLELSPRDVDICRLLARVRVRQRNFDDARELLGRIVDINPHVAGDWVALAMVQHELQAFEARDLSVARAALIDPDIDLPSFLATTRRRIGLA